MGPGRATVFFGRLDDLSFFGRQAQVLLAAADQFQINLGQKPGVLEGAVQRAVRIIDLKAPAQGVQVGLGAGELAPRQGYRIDGPVGGDGRLADFFPFGIDKAEVEFRIVDDQGRIADEGFELFGDIGEYGLMFPATVDFRP